MASNKIPSLPHGTNSAPGRRRIFFLRRRRKLPTVRLGGGGGGGEKAPRRRFLVKILRRVRVKWEYWSMLKKMKAYCRSLLRDISAGAGVGPVDDYQYSYRQMLFVETFLAVPMMAL
ncbi:hypothetical protein DM860_014347 [Cuscuta australis]|uniref:Uncharacterized protein n=1 Tax=Cuscuta australis TaxID=267555 RepID=A0A328DEJ1_9ASTE|nr:hypothetical protein DM860_014347 [Cuscuta australis]